MREPRHRVQLDGPAAVKNFGRRAVVACTIAVLSACGGSTHSPASPSSAGTNGTNGTLNGAVNGSTSLGAVAGTVSGSIATSGVMTGAINGTISAGTAGSNGIHSTAATAVSFSGSASGMHGGGSVTGTMSGTTSDGGTFTGAFAGPVDGTTRTYTASGNITFSGAVTGTVAVVLTGDCPSPGNDPPETPGGGTTPGTNPPGGGGGSGGTPKPGLATGFTGAWTGTYVLNGTSGTMTWSMAGSSDLGVTNQGTYSGSLKLMPSGAVELGPVNADNSLTVRMQLTCANGNEVAFQGTGQLSGRTVTGTFTALGGGNCAVGAPWTVAVAMKQS